MSKTFFASGLAALCLASPASADLTAEAVLADQLNLLSFGGNVTVATDGLTPGPDGLTVDAFILQAAGDDTDTEVRVGGLELREETDGSVRILYPEVVPITATWTSEAHGPVTNEFSIAFDRLTHRVTDSPAGMRHDIAFASATLSDFETTPREAVEDFDGDLDLSLTNVDTSLLFSGGNTPQWNVTFALGSLVSSLNGTSDSDDMLIDIVFEMIGVAGKLDFSGSDITRHSMDLSIDDFAWRQEMSGDDLDAFDMTMAADNFELGYDVAFSIEDFENDPGAALAEGQGVEGRLRYGAMVMDMAAETPDGPFSSRSVAGETTAALTLDSSRFSMSMETLDNRAEIVVPVEPFVPVNGIAYQVARSLVDIDIPLKPGDAPQPFRMNLAVTGIEMAEDLWAIFDSGAVLPRDPVDVELDIDGTTVIAEDPLSARPGEMPFSDTKVRLNALRLALAGAELTATGEATDTSEDGVPNGFGRIDSELTGFNTLLDRLIDLGLLTSEQAMPARMGLNLIARPGDGPDELVSTIEVNEDGQITANGQRLR